MEDFKIGDVVTLKSGGLRMTIQNVRDDGYVNCAWSEVKQSMFSISLHGDLVLQYGTFKKEMLTKVS